MNLPPEIVARIVSAVTALGDQTLPDLTGRRHSALPLYADLGGAVLLRPDGKFLELEWDEPSELQPRTLDAPTWRVALVAGAERYPWLSALLPQRPPRATTCSLCDGAGRITNASASDGYIFCGVCDGVGWIAAAV